MALSFSGSVRPVPSFLRSHEPAEGAGCPAGKKRTWRLSHEPDPMLVRVFGAALDALDDPERVGLKRAYLRALAGGLVPAGLPEDPYDALAPGLIQGGGGIVQAAGKLPVPGWLTPRPRPEDEPLVTPENYRAFLAEDRVRTWTDACSRFVAHEILPHVPCMIAVDHAMTAGPLQALASRHGPENVTVVILDSHLDAVPWELRRLTGAPGTKATGSAGHNCGSFLAALLDEGTLLPGNLFVAGVSDHPSPGTTTQAYERAYRSVLDRGVHVYPRDRVEEPSFPAELVEDLDRSRGTRLYVSLDADVGAMACMNAVRFLDTRGLPEACILDLASRLKNLIDTGRFQLAGLDAAEVDVHLLGLAGTGGQPDRTVEVCTGFLERMCTDAGNP